MINDDNDIIEIFAITDKYPNLLALDIPSILKLFVSLILYKYYHIFLRKINLIMQLCRAHSFLSVINTRLM